MDFLVGTGPAITGALFFFFFERVKDFDKGTASLLLLVYFIGGLLGAPIWTWLSYKISKHKALAVSGLFYAVTAVGVLFIPPGNVAVTALMMFLIGLPYSAGAFLLRAMMADVSDEERMHTDVDRTGLLYALLSGTVKLGSAAAVFITFNVLQWIGFDAKATGIATGLAGLSAMYGIVPAGLSLLASAIIIGFPLTEARHGEIRDTLAARDGAKVDG